MIFFLLFFIAGLCLSLFCLHHISREDFTLMKRNVTPEDMFNVAFITFFAGLFFARLAYVIFNFAPGFFNPFVFFLVPYFPGMLLTGGIMGGALVSIYYSRKKKWPTKRIFDLISLSFLAGLPIAYVGSLFISKSISYFVHFFLPFIFFIIFLVAYLALYPKLIRREIKPGMLGTTTMIVVSFISLLVSILSHLDSNETILQIQDSIPFVLFLSSLVYFIKQDLFVIKAKK